ncbi:MAG: FAD:protein FMN transferase, partial [Pirellula sp.]|nr:FAD:protein FMN transferase [Pirellula sp.]
MLLGGLGWFACPLVKAGSGYPDQRLEEIAIRAMGSEINIRWEASGAENVSASHVRATISALLEKWNSILSDYDDESEASVLTQPRNVGLWQDVSVELAEAITRSKKWFELSQGAFDVTCGAVTALRRKRRLATPAEWEAAMRTMGWDAIEWDDKKRAIKIQRQGLKFDFGGIGKGLVVDKACDLMREQGLGRCIVNFSGNLRAGDAPSDRDGWPVEIELLKADQSEETGQAEGRGQSEAQGQAEARGAYRFRLANRSMATSGDQFQSFPDWKSKSQQERTSHIL